MDQAARNKIVAFIWGIVADVLRDLFKRCKYANVIRAGILAVEYEAEGLREMIHAAASRRHHAP